MKTRNISNLQLSDLCRELSLLLHAGVGLGDGLALLAQEEPEGACRDLVAALADAVGAGTPLADALEQADCFPVYLTGLVRMGERVGRTEEALAALARYYEEREATDRQVKSALTYPAVLLMMMMVVIVVLLTRVLPVFNEIYRSLGGSLTGLAGGLLLLGNGLNKALPVLCLLLVLAVAFLALFVCHEGFHRWAVTFCRGHWGDKGVSRALNDARFAQALSMGMSSGLPLEEAVGLAGELLADVPAAVARCRTCREQLERGESLSSALGETGLLPPSACRLLTLGMRGGSGDTVMEELARRLSEDARLALEARVSRVEPALVLGASVLVGAILLCVMLPLMNIMTAIG